MDAEQKLAAIRELHRPLENSTSAMYPNPLCSCGDEYPCDTAAILDSDDTPKQKR